MCFFLQFGLHVCVKEYNPDFAAVQRQQLKQNYSKQPKAMLNIMSKHILTHISDVKYDMPSIGNNCFYTVRFIDF